MKTKHNKKRNTAFLFEVLVRELTKCLVKSDVNKSNKIKKIIKEHFRSGGVLFKELDCFNSLSKNSGLDNNTAEKLVFHAKKKHSELSKDEIFAEQSKLIKTINQDLSPQVFNNFVPNYRSFATISQIFNKDASIKKKVLMERQVIQDLTSRKQPEENMKPVDSLVLSSFAKNYNQKYNNLLPEQKAVLSRFVNLNEDTRHDFYLYIAETLSNIEREVENSLHMEEVKEDKNMVENTHRVLEHVRNFKVTNFGESQILDILKLQKLVKEYYNDDN